MSEDRKKTCNHEFGVKGSTLEQLPFELLVYPPRKFCKCSCCGKIFEYKDEDGRYQFVPSKEEGEIC